MTLLIHLLLLASLWGAGGLPDTSKCSGREISAAVELSPEIPEQPSQSGERTFYTTTVAIHYQAGEQVLLSSTLDGAGPIFTDDTAQLASLPSGQVWAHDFRSPDRTKVLPLPVQDVTHLFVPGLNHLTFFTQDRTQPVFSTQSYYLLFAKACATPTATPVPTLTATPTPWPSATPTMAPTPTATQRPSATPTPTEPAKVVATSTIFLPLVSKAVATVTPAASAAPVRTPLPQLAAMTSTGLPSGPGRWKSIGFTGMMLVSGVAVLWWRTRQRLILAGTVTIYDRGTWVRTVDLTTYRQRVVTIGSQGDIALADEQQRSAISAQLRVQQTDGGHPQLSVEFLTVPDENSANSRQANQMQVMDMKPLQHGDAFNVGRYRLVYQHFG